MKEVCCIALFDVNGRLLMGRRRDSGKFLCPGGCLEPGELPAAAAARECREEAGFDPHDLEPLASLTITGHSGKTVLVHAFRGRVPTNAVPTNANDPDSEFSELFYVDVHDGLPGAIAQNLHNDPDVCLQYLGLVKPQTDVGTLERGEAYLEIEDLQKMALADLAAGQRQPSGVFDYSHLLDPKHQGSYALQVHQAPVSERFQSANAHLIDLRTGATVGQLSGVHMLKKMPPMRGQYATIHSSEIDPSIRGQGLGRSLYEAWMKHAHASGQTHVSGEDHTAAAHGVHASLATKHGMRYRARREEPHQGAMGVITHGSYEYALKSELRKQEFQASPEQISETIRRQGLHGVTEDAIPHMNAAQLKAVTDIFVKSKISTLHSEVEAKMLRNPYLADEPRAILLDRANQTGATRLSVWTAPHFSESEVKDVWARTPPQNRRAAFDLPNIKPDMIEEVLRDPSQDHHLSPSIVATALTNPNIRPADVHRWLGPDGPTPTKNFIHYGSSHVYGMAKPELRDAIWKHMKPIIADRLMSGAKHAGDFGDMNEDHARELAAEGLVPSAEVHGDLAARFHELGLPIKEQTGIEVRPGTDKLRALRDHIATQPGQSVPVRVLKAKQMDLGVRGDARGNVGVDHVQQAIDSQPTRKYVVGSGTWNGPQRHVSGEPEPFDQRAHADAMENWRQAAELHGRESPEAVKAKQIFQESETRYRQYMMDKSAGGVHQPVFQLGVHPEAVNEMRKRGVLDAFHKLVSVSAVDSGHPAMKYGGIGWVRYDEHPDGIHVDEVQSDFDLQTLKQLAANPDSGSEVLGVKPEEVGRTVAHIGEVLWGRHNPSDVLHEAFQQHLRNQGKDGVRLHHWQLAPKAKIAKLDEGQAAPGHFQHTYDQAPRKQWGYEPSQYGGLSAQSNPDLKGQPTWTKKLQKFGQDLDAWYFARLTKSGTPCDPHGMELKKSAGKRLMALAAATALGTMVHPERAAIPEWRPAAQAQLAQNFSQASKPAIPDWRQQVPMTAADAPQSVGAPRVGTPWTPKGLSSEMHPIAHLESGWGKYLAHDRCPGGDFHTAYGALGFKPSTAHEQYKRSKIMQRAYPNLHDQGKFMERFREDPHFYNAMANNHWSWLKSQVGGDPHKAAFGWRWGIGAASRASEDEIGTDDYVQHYAALSNAGKPQPQPTMLVAKAETLDFYEIE